MDTEKLITSVTAAVAVAGEHESDYIVLTLGEGKAILKILMEMKRNEKMEE